LIADAKLLLHLDHHSPLSAYSVTKVAEAANKPNAILIFQ